jgi:TonB family protein
MTTKPMHRFALTALLSAALAVAPARADTEVDLLIAYLLDAIEAPQTRCSPEQLDGRDGERVVCAVCEKSFSSFKSDWDLVLLHSRIPIPISTDESWTYRGGGYRITYTHGTGEELRVSFGAGGKLVFGYDRSDVDPYAAPAPALSDPLALPGVEAPPRTAGFAGVSVPRLIEDSRVEPLRSFRAQAEGVVGRATLEIVVGTDGEVRTVTALNEEPAGYDFGKSAIEAVRQWKFEPATLAGCPVAAVLNETVEVKADPPPPGDG